MALDSGKVRDFVQKTWDHSIVPTLVEYIKIPNKSPMFDPEWREHGHMDRAVELLAGWAGAAADRRPAARGRAARRVARRSSSWRSPATDDDTVLLYGHLDKQPEMTGWPEGLGPWTPVMRRRQALRPRRRRRRLRDLRRAHRDPGAAGAARAARALRRADRGLRGERQLRSAVVHRHAGRRIGTPSLVVCLDSGCGNYEQLWVTTSLRGLVGGTLTCRRC